MQHCRRFLFDLCDNACSQSNKRVTAPQSSRPTKLFNVHGSQDARAAPFGNRKTETINKELKTVVLIRLNTAKKTVVPVLFSITVTTLMYTPRLEKKFTNFYIFLNNFFHIKCRMFTTALPRLHSYTLRLNIFMTQPMAVRKLFVQLRLSEQKHITGGGSAGDSCISL